MHRLIPISPRLREGYALMLQPKSLAHRKSSLTYHDMFGLKRKMDKNFLKVFRFDADNRSGGH